MHPAVPLVLAATLAVAGDEPWMSEAELAGAFAGRTIDGHYANGDSFTETYRADGGIDYKEAAREMKGRWSLRAGTFCTIYTTSPTGGCYRVRQTSANCFEFYFVARDEREAEAPSGRPDWTARAWLNGRPSTCQDGATV